MNGWKLAPIVACLAASLALPARAMGLLDAWRAAQGHEAEYRAQKLERDAAHLNADIAFGGLLPNVSASSSRSQNNGDRSFTNPPSTQTLNYRAQVTSVNLRQPLFYPEGLARYRQGKQQGEIADAVLEGKRKELATTVANAYFNVLLGRDNVALGEAELTAAEEQTRLAERRLKGGEGTRTEIAEGQARRDLAQAKLIEARDQLEVSLGTLERLTGAKRPETRPLREGPLSVRLDPASLREWIDLARDRNPEVQAARLQVENARLEVDRTRAGHFPRVDLVASVTDARNDTLNTLNTASAIRSLGVQFTLPLYSGGSVSAGTDQAVVNQTRALALLDAAMDAVGERTRKEFLAASSAATKLAAYAKAVESSTEAVKGNQLGFQAGIRTNLDVLNSQSQLFTARRDLAQARYAYLQGVLALKVAAGVLTEASIVELDALLQ